MIQKRERKTPKGKTPPDIILNMPDMPLER